MEEETFKITTYITAVVKLKNVKLPTIYLLSYTDSNASTYYFKHTYNTNSYLNNIDKQFVVERQELLNTLPTNYNKSHPLHKALWYGFVENIKQTYKEELKWDDIENMSLGTWSKIEKYESTISKLLRKVSNFFTVPDYNKEE